jgi:hypothetical protein
VEKYSSDGGREEVKREERKVKRCGEFPRVARKFSFFNKNTFRAKRGKLP